MPIITKIARQQRRQSRYSIYLDGKYRFSLGDLELSNSGLREGQELSEADVAQWKGASNFGKAYERALSFLSYRPRSTREMRDYLGKGEYEPSLVDQVIEQLQQTKLLDDTQFAHSWVESRQLLKPRSRHQLTMELRKKGLAKDVIDEALGELEPDQELAMLKTLINKKLTRYPDQQKLLSYLSRQGFSYSLIRQALDELSVTDSD